MKCPKCQTENTDTARFCSNCAAPLLLDQETKPAITKTIETSKEELTTGAIFADRYQIIEELGKGGMGKVYRTLDKKLSEEVALKLIKPEIAADKKILERFKNELKLARKISHPNVGRMYELLEHEEIHYITMEYVPGQDLKSMIKQSKQLTVGTTISIAKQVCAGLSEAHRLGVIHRDLKPSNIMIDKEGNARIMDFGIARSLKAKGITGAGVIIGTPEYMSPEQVDGKEADQRSDIYSLGIILYEMLTGTLPFVGETALSIAVQHRSDAPQAPRELNAQIPEELNSLILKCLKKEKKDRYQTIAELLSTLDELVQGIPAEKQAMPRIKSTTSKEITVRFTPKKLYIPAAIISILTLTIAAFLVFKKSGLELISNRIVVAVFENQTGNEQLDDIGKIAASWITEGLSHTDFVEVVPTMLVMQHSRLSGAGMNELKDPAKIRLLAMETGAGVVVTGTYNLVDNNLSVQAEIINVRLMQLLSALPPVQGSLEDKMEIIRTMRERVMGALASHFDIPYGFGQYQKPPLYEAYREYMLGIDSFGRDYYQSFIHFERAITLDPAFLPAKFWIATGHMNQGRLSEAESMFNSLHRNRSQLSPYWTHLLDAQISYLQHNYEKALHYCQLAEQLVPGNIILSFLILQNGVLANRPREAVKACQNVQIESWREFFSGRWGAAYFRFLSYAHHMLGNYRQELKEIQQAQNYYPDAMYAQEARAVSALGWMEEVDKVIEESLAVTSLTDQGGVMLEAAQELRRHGYLAEYRKIANRSVEWFKSKISEKEATVSQRVNFAEALYVAERWDEAQNLFEELALDFADSIAYRGRLGAIAARLGDREKALLIFDELKTVERPYIYGEHIFWCARIASLLGDMEQSILLLREALSQGQPYGIELLRNIDFEPLWNYKPFKDLIKPKG